jgi:DNA-binding GntR family transcriptional regulator
MDNLVAMTSDLTATPTDDIGFRIAVPLVLPTLYEQVYSSILEAICGGVLRAGDRINQDELAARLNVSRQPVTQALTVLRTQDFVQDAGRRGLVVAPLRKSFFESLYQLRESLDPMAAKLAARSAAKLSGQTGLELLERGRAAVEDGAVSALTSADMAFHMWIYESAGNPLLADMLRLYWNHLRRAMISVVGPTNERVRVWVDHEDILNAVLGGDEKQAEMLSLQHIQNAAQRVIGNFPE